MPPAALATTHREVIINLAARFRMPAVYPLRIFVTDGGLLSYGPATTDLYPRLAVYIDRIFWAVSATRAQQNVGTASFWFNTDRPPDDEQVVWVGAGTKDTGFSLTRLTFQVTHATDAHTNAERDFIVAELTGKQVQPR